MGLTSAASTSWDHNVPGPPRPHPYRVAASGDAGPSSRKLRDVATSTNSAAATGSKAAAASSTSSDVVTKKGAAATGKSSAKGGYTHYS